jgi:hypothetical protein
MKKLEERVLAAIEAVDHAQREYAQAREAYKLERLLKIKTGKAVPTSVLRGRDRLDMERHEAVAAANAEVDRLVRADPRTGALLET